MPRELCQKSRIRQNDQHEKRDPTSQEHTGARIVENGGRSSPGEPAHRNAMKENSGKKKSWRAKMPQTSKCMPPKILNLLQWMQHQKWRKYP